MRTDEIHQILLDRFGAERITGAKLDARDPWIEAAPSSLIDVALVLRDDPRFRFDHLNDLTAVDYFDADAKKMEKRGHTPQLEMVYHLSSYELRQQTVLKVRLPRWKDGKDGQIPDVPSVAGVWAIADWHERETYDLFGIQFIGHPNLRRILCPEDWVGHPLRKDYEMPLEYHGIRGR